jgi:flagellar hook-basal body complex protein FliE
VTVPAIGAIGGALSQSALTGLGAGETSGIGGGATAGASGGLSLGTPALAGSEQTAGTGAIGGVGGVAEAGSVTGVGGTSNAGVEGAAGGESGGFGDALTQAISSLEQSQQSASGAAQALATGTASNPESAVVTVEDAQLAMQLASQIRTKAVEAAQQIFQTQV